MPIVKNYSFGGEKKGFGTAQTILGGNVEFRMGDSIKLFSTPDNLLPQA